jgi:hypothetical protein
VQKTVQVKQTFHSGRLSQQTLYSLGVAGGQRVECATGKSDFSTEPVLYSKNRSFCDTGAKNALLTESLILVHSAQFIARSGSLLHQLAAERNIQVSTQEEQISARNCEMV